MDPNTAYQMNYHLPGAGYYHVPFHAWFPIPYNSYEAGRGWYRGGFWRPTAEPGLDEDAEQRRTGATARGGGIQGAGFRATSFPSPTAVEHANTQRRRSSRRHDDAGRLRLVRPLWWLLMKRVVLPARPDWREKVEAVGFTYHTHDTGPYWDEGVGYEFTAAEIDTLEAAANTLHALCIEAAGVVIERNEWSRVGIPSQAEAAVRASWERDDPSVYGRFDLAFDGVAPPKLLEYNADTPTALIETSVVQWHWLQECFKDADQFNSVHERLIEAWRHVGSERVHFAAMRDLPEDEQTIAYLADTCRQAGFKIEWTAIDEIGWNAATQRFVDKAEIPIEALFKLYPWEWMWHESFGKFVNQAPTLFIEPPWKLLLSNKGLLPILWELFPDHPNLLPAFESPAPFIDRAGSQASYVKKPRLSREGANVQLVEHGRTVEENEGEYGEEGFVYQALAPIPAYDGHHPVCGVWVVNHEACGLGIREDTRRITGNFSRFVPHYFR